MAILSSPISYPRIDTFTRILIILGTFFSMSALALTIVGLVTRYWYYAPGVSGISVNYNLFTLCTTYASNGSTFCVDMSQQTSVGANSQHAAALLVVAICLLGCGMLVALAMNFVKITSMLVFVGPIVLFLAALFILAAFAEGSKVLNYNSYSAILVQTGHLLTILSLGIIAFASGRLHVRFYEQF